MCRPRNARALVGLRDIGLIREAGGEIRVLGQYLGARSMILPERPAGIDAVGELGYALVFLRRHGRNPIGRLACR